ncbi:hypothetical protein B4140_1853 [Bacillus amyloliquefaciens]|nr:hypothetical protein B4140_1853 [Bacillus amyloliquefaciens]RAP15003.1 hypothetical protein HS9_00327 [Bacillus velezensis]
MKGEKSCNIPDKIFRNSQCFFETHKKRAEIAYSALLIVFLFF